MHTRMLDLPRPLVSYMPTLMKDAWILSLLHSAGSDLTGVVSDEREMGKEPFGIRQTVVSC